MSLKQVAIALIALLIITNALLSGAVVEALTELATSPEKETMRNSIQCIAGLQIYSPTKEILGIQVPMPSFTDVTIAAGITGLFLFILHLVKGSPGWKGSLLVFITIWVLFKLAGWLLIITSGEGCIAAMNEPAAKLAGLYTVSALFGSWGVYKVIRISKA